MKSLNKVSKIGHKMKSKIKNQRKTNKSLQKENNLENLKKH